MSNKIVKHLMFLVAVVALTSSLTMAQSAQSQAPISLTGTVSCEGRITHHYTCQRNQTQQTCTLACVEQGSRFVIMVGDTPYLLQGDSGELKTLAGGKATVTGVAVNGQLEVQTASDVNHHVNVVPSAMANPSR